MCLGEQVQSLFVFALPLKKSGVFQEKTLLAGAMGLAGSSFYCFVAISQDWLKLKSWQV